MLKEIENSPQMELEKEELRLRQIAAREVLTLMQANKLNKIRAALRKIQNVVNQETECLI